MEPIDAIFWLDGIVGFLGALYLAQHLDRQRVLDERLENLIERVWNFSAIADQYWRENAQNPSEQQRASQLRQLSTRIGRDIPHLDTAYRSSFDFDRYDLLKNLRQAATGNQFDAADRDADANRGEIVRHHAGLLEDAIRAGRRRRILKFF